MRFEGQVQAAIELLEEIEDARVPADKYMAGFFKKRRYMGSSDKGVVADLVYGIYRHKGELTYALKCAKAKIDSRKLMLAYLKRNQDHKVAFIADVFDGDKHNPAKLKISEKDMLKAIAKFKPESLPEKLNFPEWLEGSLVESFGENIEVEMQAMNARATSDIRVNTLKTSREKLKTILNKAGFEMREGELSPLALRMDERKSLFHLPEFHAGHFEMQDEGSQLIAAACGVKPGQKVVDFCAGAGGKTLALAAEMNNKGSLTACDIHERRLKEMPKRLKRAGVHNVTPKLLSSENDKWVKRQKGKMDVVLIDAPCSGTGTWRRSPDAKWRLSLNTLKELQQIQMNIFNSASRMVKEGGRLVYATCSVLKEENENQVAKFLAENKGFELVDQAEWNASYNFPKSAEKGMLRMSVNRDKTDGFFMAVFVKKQQDNNE